VGTGTKKVFVPVTVGTKIFEPEVSPPITPPLKDCVGRVGGVKVAPLLMVAIKPPLEPLPPDPEGLRIEDVMEGRLKAVVEGALEAEGLTAVAEGMKVE